LKTGARGNFPNLKPQEKMKFLSMIAARVAAQQPLGGNLIVLLRNKNKTKQSNDTVTKDNTAAAETHAQKSATLIRSWMSAQRMSKT
jgi:hypothetical protein